MMTMILASMLVLLMASAAVGLHRQAERERHEAGHRQDNRLGGDR